MTVYFDTSALIKLLLLEDGSETADQLWNATDVAVCSRLAYPEARATLSAAARAGRIERRALRRAAADLDRLFGELSVVEVDARLAETAGDLAERHALLGSDAVHLAAALELSGETAVVATWDRDLGRAARAEGQPIVPPVAP